MVKATPRKEKKRKEKKRKEKKRKEKELGMDDALEVFDGMASEDLDPVVAHVTDDKTSFKIKGNAKKIAELTFSCSL